MKRAFFSLFTAFITPVAFAGPVKFNVHPNSIYFTLKPDQAVVGPVLPRNANATDKQKYFQGAFREIIRKADAIFRADGGAYKYNPGANDNFSYFSFLVLALTVPHHESNVMHARQVLGSQCTQKTNEVARSNSGVRRVLQDIYRKPGRLIFPNCSTVGNAASTTQIINSGNHDDVGFMQLNPRYHRVGVEPEVFFNVPRTINYGLDFLADGYFYLRANSQKYSCSFNADPYAQKNTSPTLFYNLLRASWASKYNQGNMTPRAVCRFARSNGKDNGFKASLDSIVKHSSSLFHEHLPAGSIERAALNEIVANYKAAFTKETETEQNRYLKMVLSSASVPTAPNPDRPLDTPTVQQSAHHYLKQGKIRVYSQPTDSIPQNCGYIESPTNGTVGVEVYEAGANGGQKPGWLRVDLEGHAKEIRLFKTQLYVETKPQYSYANLRNQPVMRDSTLVARLYRSVQGRKQMMRVMQQFVQNRQRWFRVIDRQGNPYFVHESGVDLKEVEAPASAECRATILYVKSDDVVRANLEFRAGQKFLGQLQGESRIFLRSMFNSQSNILEIKNPGDQVIVIGQTQSGGLTWYKVLTNKGQEAWVWSERVKLIRAVEGGSR